MAGGEEEGRRGGVEKDDKECTHGNDSEVMSPAFLNIFNNEYWNRVYEDGGRGFGCGCAGG